MADFRKLGKGVAGALGQAKQIAAAEREANLKRFLEPSKVPQRLYHGTTATEGGKGQEAIRRIKPSKEGALGSGVYMTPRAAHASGYSGIPNDEALALMAGDPYAKKMADQFMADRASGTLREGQEGGNMLPVYAQLKNPLIIEGNGDPMIEALVKLGMDEDSASKMVERAYEQKGYIGKQVESRARAAGYDGLMQFRDGDLSEVVSYNPNAVKSAIGNQGTYDTMSPDLSKAHGGGVHMQAGGKALKGALGAIKKASAEASKAMKAPQEDALRLAQRRAALPPEKGGLGLAKNNTPEQRAKAMGINTDAYHGSKQDITGAFKPGYDDNLAFVTKSPAFANKWIGKGKLQQRSGEQAQQEVKSAEDAYREMKSRNMNYDDALNDLKGEAFDKEYDRRGAMAKAEAQAEFGSPGYPDGIHSTVYPLKVEANRTFNTETDMDVMTEFFEKNEIPPKVQDLYASGNYMMYETKPVVAYLKSKGYDSMRLRESTGDDYPTIAVFNPETTRSRFAAFDPFRKDVATAAAMGVLAPDLLAEETNKARGGAIHMQKGGKPGKSGALGKIAQAIQAADKEASATMQAGKLEEALRAKQAPMTTPQGTGLPLMPRSAGMYTPGVEQKDLPRMPTVDKARAAGKQPKYNERMQDLLDSPTARKKIDKLINQGEGLGVREWYGTEPIRQVAMDIGMNQKQFEEFMAQMASASQRNPVDQQNKMGSYLYYLSQTGQLPDDAFLMTNKIRRGEAPRPEGTAIELPEGYGSLAQGDIFTRGKQIASGDIEGALPPDRKLGTFYRNYLGNLKPVTVDVNAVRGPIIERGDPRWLASKLVEKDEKGRVTGTHFPRSDVESGKMSLKEAKARPGFWEAAPSGSEYAGFEELWQRGAKRHSMEPAEAQALGWYGSADVTALKTKPELYVENLERMIKRTAEQTGQNPRQVMEDVLRGKQYLKAKGGSVNKQPIKIKAYGKDIESKIYDEFASHINAAKGGAIKKMPWKAAQGGVPPNPSMESVQPDPTDSGAIMYAPKYAGGGRAQRFDDGGMAAQIPGQSVSAPPADPKSYPRLMAEILGRMAKDQGKEEVGSLRKPRAATDLLNRGMVAPAVGAPVDILNMGLEGIDAVRDLASGKRVDNRLASERPFLGSEHLKDVMSQYGMTTDQERPMMETALSLASPAGALKGASRAAQMAGQAKRPMMRRPSNPMKQPG
jgi:hypothetical protein